MKLSRLLDGCDIITASGTHTVPDADIEITALTTDSRSARRGSLFVCISGARSDGHDFAASAYESGCRCFLAERPLDLAKDASVTVVSSTRRALAVIAQRFYGEPAASLRLIGITGTKGKSTTAELIRSGLEAAGRRTGIIGTCGIGYGGSLRPSANTTPDALELARTLADMRDAGVETVVMEVSSQAYKLDRVYGLHFAEGVFTNLSPDHIGPTEHANMEEYISSKARLFAASALSVLNADDAQCGRMAHSATGDVIGYGIDSACALRAEDIRETSVCGNAGMSFEVGGVRFTVAMPGIFSVYNALAAIAVLRAEGVGDGVISETLRRAHVRGRLESFSDGERRFIIDYAHNGASLASVLSVLRPHTEGRLIVLFGSIGGRAELRRRELAEAADGVADLCIVTSDNPDFEDPDAIIAEICSYLKVTPSVRIADREQAIQYAVRTAERGDTVLLAGKGHEDYQIVCGKKVPFSERAILERELGGVLVGA